MKEQIKKKALLITNHVDEIIEGNTNENFINETEFEFGDKYDCYETKEFKEILDNHFKDKNVTYTFKKVRDHVVYFKVKLHDWIKD